ncbi:MAG TPA: GerMN domain-containing protein, partial [Mycobacteriales bacterium]
MRRAALLVTLLLTLAGCAAVPDSGVPVTVRTVPPVRGDGEQPDVRVQAPGPVPGAGPVEVVRAFLGSAVSSDGGHAVARSFLTREARRAWPDAGPVRVFHLRDVAQTGNDGVRVLGTMVGAVGADGSFTPDPGPVDLTFRLRRNGGAWQVAAPPPGVYLQDVYFTQVYAPFTVYFASAGARRMVPDLRYLDRALGNAQPTELVRLLLGGPSAWLSPGVRSAFPPGTRLRGNVVSDRDVLVVDLTAEAASAGAAERALLSAQLAWTLRQFPMTGVRVEVEGRPFEVAGARGQWGSLNPASPAEALPAYHLDHGGVRVLVPGERS